MARKSETYERVAADYDDDLDDVLRRLYHDEEMSQPELADELGVPRPTVQGWLRRANIEMRSRTLTDAQRLAIMVLLDLFSNRYIAQYVGCHVDTVRRYRREIEHTGEPLDVDIELSAQDRAFLLPEDVVARESAADDPDTAQDPTPQTQP